MITDAQLQAALDAFYGDSIARDVRKMRAALEAADDAAWRPIEEAPSDDLILCIATEGTQSILLGRTAIKWKYASFRHLPTPPKEPPK